MNSALNDRSPRAIRGFGCRFRMGGVRCEAVQAVVVNRTTASAQKRRETVMYETTETP